MSKDPTKSRGLIIFAILALGYVLVYFHRLCPAVVAVDMMEDLEAGGGLIGLLGSAYFYPYALMQLPAGLLSDSWGPRKTITVFFAVACLGSIVLGLAPNVFIAILGRTLVGIGVSMLFVPTMKILAEWFSVKDFASMTGLFVAMGGIGSLTATTPLAWLSDAMGWRNSFILVGVGTLGLGVLVWLLVRDRPEQMGLPAPKGHLGSSAPRIGLSEGVKKVLTHWPFWPLALWFFFECAVFFAFIGMWGGPYLMHVHGLDKPQAGNVLAMSAFGMVVGSPLLSFLSNRVFKGRKPLLVIASFMTLAITLVLFIFTGSISTTAMYALCFFMGVFANAIVVIGFTTSKELFPVSMAGTSTGLVNFFPFLGGALMQPLLGMILERTGKVGDAFTVDAYKSAFLAMVIAAALAAAASLFTRETLAPEQDNT